MGNGYPTVQPDDLSAFRDELRTLANRVKELERPTGTQIYEAVSKVKEAIDSIGTLVDAYLSSGFTTGSMHATGTAQVDGVFKNAAAYSNPITTSFRVLYTTSVDGQFGFNLSSAEFKQDVDSYQIDLAAAAALRVVTFRYIQAVDLLGDDAAIEVGLIAEEVHELGLHWLVDYNDETGRPEGVKFDRLALAALALSQDHEKRIQKLERALLNTPL